MACLPPPPMTCLPPPMTCLPPPCYTPSVEAPCYSLEPGPTEQRLALAAFRHGRRSTPTGVFTRKNSAISLAFRDQEEGIPYPTYGRGALVCGDIALKNPQNVLSVTVKLEGRLSLTLTEGISNVRTFLSTTSTVWKADEGSSSACPSMFPFEVMLPVGCQDVDRVRPLPPTFNSAYPGVPDIFINCNYTLTVRVVKARNLKLWKPQKTLHVQILYRPRTRPHQPILGSPFPFYSSIKSLPEEWHQVVSAMPVRPDSGIAPLECHLFIPAVQIYALTDTIPFYLQLHAPPSSIQAFLYTAPPPSPRLSRSKSRTEPPAQPTVRVYISRQITAFVNGQRVTRSCPIGEGTLRSLPPDAAASSSVLRTPEGGCGSLEWEGEVKCRPDVNVGGFNVGKLVVRDFIALHLVPPLPASSPLMEHKHQHCIRMVTDSFLDNPEPTQEEPLFS
ncbi:hypothetical protein DENSPDRAFT_835337 [Dentipellis sp. KUC8613]|nr:hypothetical protein DENSPDRAFT_835337 [Dentipellis sp. KUC8613]